MDLTCGTNFAGHYGKICGHGWRPLRTLTWPAKPSVILLVGVNGSGKTTTMAKLGQRFKGEGKSVIFGAADTFRAAAVDQLQVWGKRLDIDVGGRSARERSGRRCL